MAQHDQQTDVASSLETNGFNGARAPWTTPQVIVSDLADARGASITPGADGASGSYTYGS